MAASPSQWIRSLRPPKREVDPFTPLGSFWETERTPGGTEGEPLPTLTLLLAGAECPFTCVFCDLWRDTLAGPTPPGALPAQLRVALSEAGELPVPAAIKLYNASNFFEPRAVPPEDEAEMIALLKPFSRVTVECHPRLVGSRCLDFAARLGGRSRRLEVAMGLETAHEEALARLNKGMLLADFDRAAATLRGAGIALRAFVLVAPPFVPAAEAALWAVRSAAHAFAQGAERVALIPVREGNGALEALREAGEWTPPTLEQLEEALERCLAEGIAGKAGIVTVDLWDVLHLARCFECGERRLDRLTRMNRSGRVEPRLPCAACGWS